MATLREWLLGRLGLRRGPVDDPFEVLRVQMRLAELARQIQVLEADPHVYAKAHRLRATHAAYDDLLVEACRLAGVDIEDAPRDRAERWREELELSSRGWSW
ncbi:MAG TPA: hypothetical protein VFD41_03080 [Actinomycetales bacterium]|nr:hypothetical protein [Actinomycetales bacterium]